MNPYQEKILEKFKEMQGKIYTVHKHRYGKSYPVPKIKSGTVLTYSTGVVNNEKIYGSNINGIIFNEWDDFCLSIALLQRNGK